MHIGDSIYDMPITSPWFMHSPTHHRGSDAENTAVAREANPDPTWNATKHSGRHDHVCSAVSRAKRAGRPGRDGSRHAEDRRRWSSLIPPGFHRVIRNLVSTGTIHNFGPSIALFASYVPSTRRKKFDPVRDTKRIM